MKWEPLSLDNLLGIMKRQEMCFAYDGRKHISFQIKNIQIQLDGSVFVFDNNNYCYRNSILIGTSKSQAYYLWQVNLQEVNSKKRLSGYVEKLGAFNSGSMDSSEGLKIGDHINIKTPLWLLDYSNIEARIFAAVHQAIEAEQTTDDEKLVGPRSTAEIQQCIDNSTALYLVSGNSNYKIIIIKGTLQSGETCVTKGTTSHSYEFIYGSGSTSYQNGSVSLEDTFKVFYELEHALYYVAKEWYKE